MSGYFYPVGASRYEDRGSTVAVCRQSWNMDASVMIASELGSRWGPVRIFRTGADIVTVGIGTFLCYRWLRVS